MADFRQRLPQSRQAGLVFRPMDASDLEFLSSVYASTRDEELRQVPWTQDEKRSFLHQQFEAQHAHYMQHYPDADWWVIECNGEKIGRLYVEVWPSEHRLIDIALLPPWRGRGLGALMLTDLMSEACAAGKPLRIHVEKNNPAMRLYVRLGFVSIEDKGVYDLLEWKESLGKEPRGSRA